MGSVVSLIFREAFQEIMEVVYSTNLPEDKNIKEETGSYLSQEEIQALIIDARTYLKGKNRILIKYKINSYSSQ